MTADEKDRSIGGRDVDVYLPRCVKVNHWTLTSTYRRTIHTGCEAPKCVGVDMDKHMLSRMCIEALPVRVKV